MDYRTVIQNSIDYIEDNLKTEIAAAELARQAGYGLRENLVCRSEAVRLEQQSCGCAVFCREVW